MSYVISCGNMTLWLRAVSKFPHLFRVQVLGLFGWWITFPCAAAGRRLARDLWAWCLPISGWRRSTSRRRLSTSCWRLSTSHWCGRCNYGIVPFGGFAEVPLSTLLMSPDGDSPGALAAAGGASAQHAQRAAMERFLADVEKRAYQHALLGLRHREDALDAVQDAMLQLCRRYADRPAAEWRPLFFRILVNKVQDQRRRRMVRGRWLAWWTQGNAEDDEAPLDPLDTTPDTRQEPLRQLVGEDALRSVAKAVEALPPRQQQAFMLRNVEGLDIAETALAMGCSEGSVKTHYFRAVQALRAAVGETAP